MRQERLLLLHSEGAQYNMVKLFKIKPSYRFPLFVVLTFHALLIIALSVSLTQTHYRWHSNYAQKPIVKAVAVDAQAVNKQIKQIKWEQAAKERRERQRLQKLKQRARKVSQARIAEQKRIRRLKANQKQLQQQQALREKEAAVRAKALQTQVKRLHQQALSENQQRLQQRLLDQQMQAEKAQISKQKQALEKAHLAQFKGVLNKYRAQILQLIQNNWHPLVQNSKLYSQFMVHVAPGGLVTNVDLLKSSGNAALDRSARLAIIKSSPLPVPKDAALFDRFRQFRIKMSPQEVKGIS